MLLIAKRWDLLENSSNTIAIAGLKVPQYHREYYPRWEILQPSIVDKYKLDIITLYKTA